MKGWAARAESAVVVVSRLQCIRQTDNRLTSDVKEQTSKAKWRYVVVVYMQPAYGYLVPAKDTYSTALARG